MTTIEAIDAARILLNEPLDSTRSFPDNTSSFWTDSELMTFGNMVQDEVAQEIVQVYEDYFLTQTSINVQNGKANYSLPLDFVKMKRVEDRRTTTQPIEIIPIRMNEQGGGPSYISIQFANQCYYLRGTELVLDVTPSISQQSGITVHYIKRLPELTTASDVSEIPKEYHRILVWGIIKYALFKQQTTDTLAEREYANNMRKIREYAESRNIQRSRKVVLTKFERNY